MNTKHLWGRGLLAAAAAIAAQPAAAQDTAAATPAPAGPTQTVEGAQEFLRLITHQFQFVSGDITDSNNFGRSVEIRFEPGATPCATRSTRKYEWRSGTFQSDPNSDAETNFDSYITTLARAYNYDAANAAVLRKNSLPTLTPAEISWSSVASVKTYKSGQYETTERGIFVGSQPGFWIVAPDAPTAARVTYAMEFLRSACDQSASTGF